MNRETAWASGAGGTVLRTVDGGRTWAGRPVPEAYSLDFRDLHAVAASRAYLLSIGEGDKSRIYRTVDGGATWTRTFTNSDPKGFLDALAFWDAEHGLAFGDPVDGRFVILTTDDCGSTWKPILLEGMPLALKGEGAFAASGTCLVVEGTTNAWFATGGGSVGRVFRSTNRGRTWTVHETPIRAGAPSAGIFSLAFRDAMHGVAVGGDYAQPDESGGFAFTNDGGRTWEAAKVPEPADYRSAVAFVPGTTGPTWVAVGPTGSDISDDDGRTWRRLGTVGFDAVGFVGNGIGWAVGEKGRIARFSAVPGNERRRP